jgi:hypothetical protein
MTGLEYNDLQNRTHVTSALHHLRSTMFAEDGDEVSRKDVFEIIAKLAKLEAELATRAVIDE